MERAGGGEADIYVLKFRCPDGAGVWALWSAHEDGGWQIALRNAAGRPAPLTVQLAGGAPSEREWGARGWAARPARLAAPGAPQKREN